MNPSSQSPELQPNSTPEHNFPPLEDEAALVSPEQQEVSGVEKQAEQGIERDKTDQQVVMPTDDSQTANDQSEDSQPANSLAADQSAGHSLPDLADDVDVIEKAWVDKAKQIINETKDDPHSQEKAFEQLQIEYHKKRYGRDIKASRQ